VEYLNGQVVERTMKRKIVIGLLIQTAVFLTGGLYLAHRIRAATDDVGRVVSLHRVEHLRKRYLIELNTVLADLAVESTGHPRRAGVCGRDIQSMVTAIDGCFECHHSDESTRDLGALKTETYRFRDALDRVSATPAGTTERRANVATAWALGDSLIAQTIDTIERTSRGLERRTLESMGELERAKDVLYGLVAIGPLLSALFGIVCFSSLARPLEALVAATRRLRSGELDHRVEGLQDEFGQLATSFNEMAGAIQEQVQALQRTEQLAVAGELAAGLVHEIKNPLAGIKAAVQVLSREAALSDEDREVLRRVGKEIVGLDSLLKAFLGFARPARPQLAETKINDVIESVVAFWQRTHAPEKGRAVRVETELGALPPVRVDPLQLQQVLLNLLLNAVDALPDGGVVRVRTGHDTAAGRAFVEVADTGRGIDPAQAPKIFRPFFTTKSGGTGLGLCVSKRLVEQHGGSLGFRPARGGGSVFRVELPAPPLLARTA
jgi:signal transduction histidine kinase